MISEEFRYRTGIFTVPLHPQHQGLQAAHGQVGVEWSGHRAGAVLQESELLVQLFVVGDQRTSHHVGMAADVLGSRVQHHIGAQPQRLLQRG
ncbi:Uncharacterised protein [Mycobacterium tuberculosis]|nr:Uncharacterised protein [Mycobacterium tuberculosis]